MYMNKKQKILFVCLGNICRSPLGEGLMKHKIEERGLKNRFEVDSCGTGAWHIGEAPDPRTLDNAKSNGIILNHRGRQIHAGDLEEFDHILAMDRSNFNNILKLNNSGKYRHKIKLLRDFDPDESGADVPDPYFGGNDGFQLVFDIIDKCTEEWLNQNVK